MRWTLGVSVVLALGMVPALAARVAPTAPPDARTAAERGIGLIQKGAARYITTQNCFSCHHQSLPMMSVALAQEKGLRIDVAAHEKQTRFTEAYFLQFIDEMPRGLGVFGANDTVGYVLTAFKATQHPRDPITDALGMFLIKRQLSDGSWMVSSTRPPLEGSVFTTTSQALEGLKAYAPKSAAADAAAAREKAMRWLQTAKPVDTEDRVYQLRAFAEIGDVARTAETVGVLRAAQREDGGWSQLPRLKSDAYATGQVLIALNEAGGLATTDPVYQKGLAYLLGTQAPDGSWKVSTRAKPQQTFFDNGDPYGKSQFISFTATNLATTAILRSLK